MTTQRETAGFAALAGLIAILLGGPAAGAFEPVSLAAPTAPIRLSVLGTYRGNVFSRNTPATPPAYDPATRRLFVGSVDRGAIDVLDISNPASPRKAAAINLKRYGEPNSLATRRGLLAAAVKNPTDESDVGKVLLFRTDGAQSRLSAKPIELPTPSRIAFTPDGHRLVVTLSGAPNDDYSRDPEAGVAIIDLASGGRDICRLAESCHLRPTVRIVNFRRYNAQKAALIAAGVRIYGPNNPTVAQDLNPEGLAVAKDSRRAWVTLERNNAIAEIDLEQAQVVDLFAFGSKDHAVAGNGFDASDQDGGINIRAWPVRSFYSADGIAALGEGRQTFLITANEGDPKDTDVYSEKIRVGEDAYVLDPRRFPNAALLKQDSRLGRLQVTKVDGDTDRDGDFDRIFMLGSRSLAVWTTEGKLVFDSGNDFEQITARAVPAWFNTGEDENKLDSRSDDRGPEPEHLTVGRIGRHTYAFIGFERIGGIIVYEVTNPRTPRFVQYINNRNFALDPKTECPEKEQPMTPRCIQVGDLEPEGFVFISRRESPIGVPLLAVIHELSDSTTLYRIDRIRRTP
jgi:hypothetical protein